MRCNNPTRPEYPNYGGRGIRVCDEWEDYVVFRDWAMAHGWSKGLHVDRIDNDGDYSPTNCRIVTPAQNARNKRSTRWITVFGETKSMLDWSEDSRCPVAYETLESRLRAGWTPEEALTAPRHTKLAILRRNGGG